MSFEWPQLLWGWLLLPLLALGFARLRRARAREGLPSPRRGASPGATPARAPGMVPERAPSLLPPLLYGLSLMLLVAAAARPVAVVSLPSLREVVILAIDVSNSMRADDLKPTRLAAARAAAREFIEAQPATTRIGLVAFAETALAVRRPTTDRDELLQSLERLEPQRGTAVGEAILVSLQALFPKERFEFPVRGAEDGVAGGAARSGADARAGGRGSGRTDAGRDGTDADAKAAEVPARQPGSETSAAIVLLTDGAATRAPDPLEAAKLAARRGVRVFTVGLGTADGAVVQQDGVSMRVQLDEERLRKVADITRGRFFRAGNADDLRAIYREVGARLVLERRETEVGAPLVAIAALFTLMAAALSLAASKRIL